MSAEVVVTRQVGLSPYDLRPVLEDAVGVPRLGDLVGVTFDPGKDEFLDGDGAASPDRDVRQSFGPSSPL